MDLRQFKLVNDDEIICEVLEWNNEETSTIVVRRALKIIAVDDLEGSMRYYTFKPWMLMNNDPDALQVLNSTHIVSESSPAKVAIEYYNDVINELKADDAEVEIISPEYETYDSDEAPTIFH